MLFTKNNYYVLWFKYLFQIAYYKYQNPRYNWSQSTTYNLQDKFPFRSDVTERTFQQRVLRCLLLILKETRWFHWRYKMMFCFYWRLLRIFWTHFKWFQKILVRFEKFLQHRWIKTGGRTQIFSFEMLQPCNENQFNLHLPMVILKAGYSNCNPRQIIGDSYKTLFIMAVGNSSLKVLCILS